MAKRKNRRNRKKAANGAMAVYSGGWVQRAELSPQVTTTPRNIFATLAHAREQLDTYTMILSRDDVISTSSAGEINTVFSNDPAIASNWSSLAAVFDEYRVLAQRLYFRPISFNGNLVSTAAIASVIDYDTASALTGYMLANQYSSVREAAGGKPFTRTAYMSGVENAGFISTMSSSSTFWLKLWSANNSVSTKIGNMRTEWIVQFRGKGI